MDFCANEDIYYWQLWHHNWDDHEIEIFLARLPLLNKTVLEVGCGDGRVAFALAPHCRKILGVDRAGELIDIARNRLQKTGLLNIGFEVMDAQCLQIASDSLDVVLYPWVLHMVEERDLAMQEAYRVLRPGGYLAVLGIHSDGDYDRIIAPFVADAGGIDPIEFYEGPIARQFDGPMEVLANESFPYIFENVELARDAFAYSLKFYYRVVLNDWQKQELGRILEDYECEGRVRINFYASLYIAQK